MMSTAVKARAASTIEAWFRTCMDETIEAVAGDLLSDRRRCAWLHTKAPASSADCQQVDEGLDCIW